MSITLADFRTRIRAILQDDAEFIEDEWEMNKLILTALGRYNHDKPLERHHDISGDGGYDYSLPNDWIEGFSRITQIEYPEGNQTPTYLGKEKYTIYYDGSAYKIRFLEDSPGSSETARVTYLIPHTLTDASSTIYIADFEAFSCLGAAFCMEAIANKMTQTKDPIITADAVNYADKTRQCTDRAKHLTKLYESLLGIQGEDIQASIQCKDFDTTFLWGGRHLTHEQEYR